MSRGEMYIQGHWAAYTYSPERAYNFLYCYWSFLPDVILERYASYCDFSLSMHSDFR